MFVHMHVLSLICWPVAMFASQRPPTVYKIVHCMCYEAALCVAALKQSFVYKIELWQLHVELYVEVHGLVC